MPIKQLIAGLLLILGAYGCFEAWPLIAGPSLSIASVTEASLSQDEGVVHIKGKASRAATLTLDGAPLLHDQDGQFSSTLTFPRGGSILTFVATDRFGRAATSTHAIFVPHEFSYTN
ncbi:MAG: hypothetical protein Q7J45_02310 [bacterium]|nr:hypothetical protein [bacterium]